jgi:hypothetical protein
VGGWKLISQALIPLWVGVDGFIEGTPDIPQAVRPTTAKAGWAISTTRCSFRPTRPSRLYWGIGPSITFKDYPIRQTPASFSLDKVLAQIERAGSR